jgi:hypothetical protein
MVFDAVCGLSSGGMQAVSVGRAAGGVIAPAIWAYQRHSACCGPQIDAHRHLFFGVRCMVERLSVRERVEASAGLQQRLTLAPAAALLQADQAALCSPQRTRRIEGLSDSEPGVLTGGMAAAHAMLGRVWGWEVGQRAAWLLPLCTLQGCAPGRLQPGDPPASKARGIKRVALLRQGRWWLAAGPAAGSLDGRAGAIAAHAACLRAAVQREMTPCGHTCAGFKLLWHQSYSLWCGSARGLGCSWLLRRASGTRV